MRSRHARASVTTAMVLMIAAACSSSNSSGWEALPPDGLASGTARLVHVAVGPGGLIGAGSVTTGDDRVPALWRSADGRSWQRLDPVPKSVYGFVSELTAV